MAYGVKYTIIYKDKLNRDTEIQLLRNGYSGTITELKGSSNPLTLSSSSDKFETISGTAAQLELISYTDRQLIELYTANPKEWMIKILKDNSLFFVGYLESEMYKESFTEVKNYRISVLVNDGIGMLDRIKYSDTNNSQFIGYSSIWTVINRIISKMGLPYQKINIVTDLKETSVTIAANQNIFQFLMVNNGNFYDEDDKPMTCREVIESILKPFGLTFLSQMGQLWIVDREYLNVNSPIVKSYNINSDFTFSYFQTYTLVNSVNLYNHKQLNNSTDFSIEAGYNTHILTKNRYIKGLYKEQNFDSDYMDVSAIANFDGATKSGGSTITDVGYNYIRYYTGFPNWISYDPNVCKFVGIRSRKDKNFDDIPEWTNTDYDNFILVYRPYPNTTQIVFNGSTGYCNDFQLPLSSTITKKSFSYSSYVPYFGFSDKSILRLSFNAKVLSKGYWEWYDSFPYYRIKDTSEANTSIIGDNKNLNRLGYFHYLVHILLRDSNGNIIKFLKHTVNDSTWNRYTEPPKQLYYEWVNYTGQTDSEMYCRIIISNMNEEESTIKHILNNYVEVKVDIPLNHNTVGKIDVIFWNRYYYFQINNSGNLYSPVYWNQSIEGFGFKNFKTSLLYSNTLKPVDLSDEEIEFEINNTNQFKTESIDTELKNYNYDSQYPNDLAAILIYDSSFRDAASWFINSNTEQDLIDLIGKKYIRNFENSRIVLTGNISSTDINFGKIGNNSFNKLSSLRIPSDPMWNSKKWVITDWNYNDIDCIAQFKAQE